MDLDLHGQPLQLAKVIHGIAHCRGGVPALIIQKEEKNKDCAKKLRGMTMAAKLHNSDACPDLFAVSV
jgi:hypothetical protein